MRSPDAAGTGVSVQDSFLAHIWSVWAPLQLSVWRSPLLWPGGEGEAHVLGSELVIVRTVVLCCAHAAGSMQPGTGPKVSACGSEHNAGMHDELVHAQL